ncbi:MAG: ABC transporter ATP-binding protein, partial [Deltaproteobacteria bacterium]|nr:ABC transporter ATP-binding protein [Deltaproteobacteria bacterium]
MPEKNADPIIEKKNLAIRFGGHVAVDHVNLRIEP